MKKAARAPELSPSNQAAIMVIAEVTMTKSLPASARQNKRGPKHDPLKHAVVPNWGTQPGETGLLLPTFDGLNLNDEIGVLRDVVAAFPGGSWRDYLRGTAPAGDADVEAEVSDQLRTLRDLGLIHENQLDPGDLPGELDILVVDVPGVAKVIQRGPIDERPTPRRLASGKQVRWPDVTQHRAIITSMLDLDDQGRPVIKMLPVFAAGSSRPYLAIERRLLERYFPRLVDHLRPTGLFSPNATELRRLS